MSGGSGIGSRKWGKFKGTSEAGAVEYIVVSFTEMGNTAGRKAWWEIESAVLTMVSSRSH